MNTTYVLCVGGICPLGNIYHYINMINISILKKDNFVVLRSPTLVGVALRCSLGRGSCSWRVTWRLIIRLVQLAQLGDDAAGRVKVLA